MRISGDPDPLGEEHGDAVMGALWLAPEVAGALGVCLAMLSQYEIMLLAFYRFAAGVGGEFVPATFGRILNIRTRLEIIEDLVIARGPEIDPERHGKALDLLRQAKVINGRRNELVHGTYRVYPRTGLVVLATWALSSRGKPRAERLTSKRLARDVDDIKSFSGEVLALCGVEAVPLDGSTFSTS